MKYKIKYLIFALLLISCEDADQVQESISEVNEFLVQKEQETAPNLRASASKDVFVSGDKIHVYGYSKSLEGGTGTRFMPLDNGTIGATYVYEKDQDGWHRFLRDQTDGLEMGFWRTGLYHDFIAYYREQQPVSPNLVFTLASDGLPKKELLWGKANDIYFSGEARIIPKITFKHQLSRIKVEVLHDMDNITTEDFKITQIEYKLNRSEATFNLEAGLWSNIVNASPGHQITETFSGGIVMNNTDFPKLTLVEIADWWVLPGSSLSDFVFSIRQKGKNKDFPMSFESLFDENETGIPTEIITKPGYITVLRIEFGEIKQIIFTVSLRPWEVDARSGDITDNELVK